MLSNEKLRFLRLIHKLTQKDLAEKMGVSRNYISMIENNKEFPNEDWINRYVQEIYNLAEEKKQEQQEKAIEICKGVEENLKQNQNKNKNK
ncbi:helix-turn-helix domain-containing protein [Clostridium novyi]|uniref:helix-turn-helix domain-containing protein n=1 Tax=Clostridium novyi TaxID=1542 RepID=UPI00069EAA26|nr:helix-turn-helix transcriptional regulator [Clostridium novyi]